MTSSSCVDTPAQQTQGPAVPAGLVWLFAVAAGASVANVYYAQPLLDAIAQDLGIPLAAVGGVITATQLGAALALLLLVPLGDRLNRRPLMAWQLLALVLALLAVALAPSALLLMGAMLAVGLLGTAMTQGLIAYAASAAPPHAQGRWWAARKVACLSGCCWRGCWPGPWAMPGVGAAFICARQR